MSSVPRTNERASPRALSQGLSTILPVYGLPILMVALIVLFSIVLPETFPTRMNLNSILSDKAIIAMLALAAMIPMLTNKIDLTVGYGIVLWHILAITLQTRFGLPWPAAVAIVLLLGLGFGLLNGLLVEMAKIDSFIATLGSGTIVYAIALWHTGGRQVVGTLPDAFYRINGAALLGLPISTWYVVAIALLLWVATEYLPVGRFLYAIGANPRAAQLNGIPVRRYVIGAFMSSGLLTAFAGVVLASKLGIGQASVGLEYLLPALVGAFLGSTTIRPGRVNVWGTLVGVGLLAVGISGIQQLGGAFFVEPLFNGVTLLIAIGIAGYGSRRRSRAPRRVPSRTTSNASTSAAKR
ncbi:ABC transporter permease [Trinickia soli]|uniref:ABC transporter permease n=1 Tax=Trinickia soli TaxID=380675 RepID=UPI003FA391D9